MQALPERHSGLLGMQGDIAVRVARTCTSHAAAAAAAASAAACCWRLLLLLCLWRSPCCVLAARQAALHCFTRCPCSAAAYARRTVPQAPGALGPRLAPVSAPLPRPPPTAAEGKPIPTELRREEAELRREVELEDDNTAVPRTHIDDEYAHAGERDPKILITTSRDPSSRLVQFAKEVKLLLPNSQRVNRGSMVGGRGWRGGRAGQWEVVAGERAGRPGVGARAGGPWVGHSTCTHDCLNLPPHPPGIVLSC